jgi:tetratricopeptide (TPR) repeat protein
VENHWGIAFWLQILGDVALRRDDPGAAESLYQEALALLSELGDQRGIAESLHRLGHLALQQGDQEEARAFLDESLALQRELGDRRGIARALYHTAELALQRGDWAEARARYEESLAIRRELGDERSIAECLEGLAALAGVRGQREQAATLFGAAEILRDSTRLSLPLVEYFRSRAVRSRPIARKEFNESTFEAAWSQGRLLRLDQAIAYALEARD